MNCTVLEEEEEEVVRGKRTGQVGIFMTGEGTTSGYRVNGDLMVTIQEDSSLFRITISPSPLRF